jgi:hypothetical protein
MVGKVKWKLPELPLSRKIVIINNIAVLEGLKILLLTLKSWVFPTMFPFGSSMQLTQKADGSCRMTGDYCKSNQVVILMVTVLDVVLLLEQINTPPGTYMQLLIWP